MYRPEIYINGERLDLFNDENISIVSSVQKIEDISRVFNDYSQSFTVPASQRNNRIFEHWYNFDVKNGFDARVRHEANIDIQSMNFRRGTIRLESCEMHNGRPKHYKLTFFGQLIELKSVIGEDYLSSLDFSVYDMAYSSTNVLTGLTTGYVNKDYIFPLISTDKQWFYNSNVTDTTNQEKLANIAWNGSGSDHGMNWTSLRPGLKVMRIIEAIETRYGITFSRDFLGTNPFDNLYLWMANSDSEEALKRKTRVTGYDSIVVQQPAFASFNNSTGSIDIVQGEAFRIKRAAFITESTDGVGYSIQLMNGSDVLGEETGTGNLTVDVDLSDVAEGASFYGRIITTAQKTIDRVGLAVDEFSEDKVAEVNINIPFILAGSQIRSSDFMPTIKVMDFLKSIIKCFNLTVLPSSEKDFDIYTLDDWYSKGSTYNISKYVYTSESSVNRAKIFREIKFAFAEPQTVLADKFKKLNKTAYGDLETKLKNSNGKPLDGEVFDIEVDFEQMVYEKLIDLNDDSSTNIVYGLSLDEGLDSAIPQAHLFYATEKNVSSNPISYIQQNGTKLQVNGNIFMPSHSNGDQDEYSTCFGGEVNEHTGGVINNSFYKLYYKDYITDSFSVKRRKIDIRARLPMWMLNKLKLNDKLVIGTDRFLINEMTVNVTNQMIDFELLNDIFGETQTIIEEEVETDPTPPTPPPVQGNSFTMSAQGASTTNGGCAQTPNTVKYWNGSESQPTLGNFIHNEIGLSTVFQGSNLYYKISNDKVIRINGNGIVTDVFFCSQGGGGGNQ